MTEPETIRYFNALACHWGDRYSHSVHFRRRLETVLAWVEQEPPGSSLLDFGCGSGVMVRSLVERGFRVTGVDVSSHMIAAARAHLEGADLERYRLEEITAGSGDGAYVHATYHGVLCIAVLEYVQDISSLLARLGSLTATGGFMILSVPNRRSVLRQLERLLHRPPLRTVAVFTGLVRSESYLRFQARQFTLPAVDHSLRQLGFAREEICYQVAPSPLRGFENRDWIGMNLLLKYRKRYQPPRP